MTFYNPPINFRWILLATLRHVIQISGQLSRNNPRPNRYLSSECFRRGETYSKNKNFNFSFLLFDMEVNQTRVVESSDIKKLIASAVPKSTKKSREDFHE